MIHDVRIKKTAKQALKSAPDHVQNKFAFWRDAVVNEGLERVRKSPGWHDEPLHGKRKGQRSIRLSRQWRAIYEIKADGSVEFVEIQEVNPHDYRC